MTQPAIIECEACDLDETRISLAERGFKIVNTERTVAGYKLTIEPCDCDMCRLARGEPLSTA